MDAPQRAEDGRSDDGVSKRQMLWRSHVDASKNEPAWYTREVHVSGAEVDALDVHVAAFEDEVSNALINRAAERS